MNLFLIAIGGGFGAVARHLSVEAITKISGGVLAKFSWGTFGVNVLGSMLAGVLYYFVIKNFDNFDPRLKNFLFAGFLGGFTTFSAFSLDFFRLATAGQILQAFIYAASTVLLSILALFFGFYASKLIFS